MNFFNNPSVHIPHRDIVERKIRTFSPDKTQIVADYDATITKASGEHSWSIFESNASFSDGYREEARALFEINHPLELDKTIPPDIKNVIMQKWWSDCLNLFIKHRLHSSDIRKILSGPHSMEFREGFREFLEQSSTYSIPVIVLSAGVANVIESFLSMQDSFFPNIHIASNRLRFGSDGLCNGFESDNIIHSHNKSEHDMNLALQERVRYKSDIILLGDSLPDVEMVAEYKRKDALKIAFVSGKKLDSISSFIETFDIVIESADKTHNVPVDVLAEIMRNSATQ